MLFITRLPVLSIPIDWFLFRFIAPPPSPPLHLLPSPCVTPTPQALRSNISELVESIEVEEAKAEQLRKRIAASTGDTLDRQEELLRQLNKEVSSTSLFILRIMPFNS